MGPPSQLTPCDRPLLCTAVLRPRLTCDPIRDSHTAVIPGSARTRHRFGDKGGRGGDLLAARRDGCQAEGWAARRDCVPCAPPLGLAGRTRAARRSPLHRTVRRNQQARSAPRPSGVIRPITGSELLTPNQIFGSRQTAAPSPDRKAPRSTSVGTSTTTDDHGHPRT